MPAKVPENFGILELYPHTNTDLGVLQLIGLVWTRATTPCMVLDLHFEFMEKFTFPLLKCLSLVPATPPYYVLFAPLAFIHP
jgi:hypothetical protein